MTRHRRPGSVRLRVTAAATVAVALVLAVAGYTLVRTQRGALTEDVDDAAIALADDVAAGLAAGPPPVPLVVAGVDDDTSVQLVDDGGEVITGTDNVVGLPPLRPDAPDGRVVVTAYQPHDEARFRVVSMPVTYEDGTATLHVAASLDDVDDSVAALRRSLFITAPLVLVALAGVVWFVVGRTLRPVEEANRRQQQFVADASHELRTPLARIRGDLEVDLAHPGRADPLATHRSVLEEAERLQRLVDDLLHTARADAGAVPGRRSAVDLDDLVLAEAERIRAEGRVGVELGGVSAAQVPGVAGELGRVVRNLADNAARHARTTVAFTVGEQDGAAVLAVVDDGPGIPAAARQRVFERFARVDDARSTEHGGTGLGLAIAREIVERHGGTIAVDPGHAGGARLVVTLPLTRR